MIGDSFLQMPTEGIGRLDRHRAARPPEKADATDVIVVQFELSRFAASQQVEAANGRALAVLAHMAPGAKRFVYSGVDDFGVQLESHVRRGAMGVLRVTHAKHSACHSFRRNLEFN